MALTRKEAENLKSALFQELNEHVKLTGQPSGLVAIGIDTSNDENAEKHHQEFKETDDQKAYYLKHCFSVTCISKDILDKNKKDALIASCTAFLRRPVNSTDIKFLNDHRI